MKGFLLILVIAAISPTSESYSGDTWKDVSNYRGWSVSRLILTGIDSNRVKWIRKGLELAGDDAALYEKVLSDDIARIRLYLARAGYPYSRVSPVVSRETGKKAVVVELAVAMGSPVVVGSVELAGIPETLYNEAAEKVLLNAGDVFTEGGLESCRKAIHGILLDAGYARAEAASSAELVEPGKVNVRIEAEPGKIYYFSRLAVMGAADDLNGLALSSLNIRQGERFRPKTVSDAQDNLSSLNLFRQIRISLVDSAPDSLGMIVALQERKHRMIELAGGYWSDDGFSARIRWRHANLFKRGRGVSIEAGYTQYRRRGEFASWWPALFTPRLTGTLRLGYNNIIEDSFEKSAPGIGLSFSYPHTRSMTSTIGYTIERASYTINTTESEYFEDPKGPVSFFWYKFVRDGTDDRIHPETGTYSWIRLQYGPPGEVSNSGHALAEFSGTVHVPISRRIIFASNVRLGAAGPIEPSVVLLPDQRFYAGGSISHRGFNRRKLGPLAKNGLPLGGEIAALGFFEIRFPLVWKLDGAVFLDWGQVWRTHNDIDWRNMEIAVGPAIRVMTPVGPLRFDLGYRLTDHEPREPEYAFHFAIGYPM